MKNAAEIIIEKFDELVAKANTQDGLSNFTRAERAIWFIVSIRCEIDMEGFQSVFDQAVSKGELIETVSYLNLIDLPDIAHLFDQCLILLEANSFYGSDGEPITGSWDLAEPIQDQLDTLGKKIKENDVLWEVDEQLSELLRAETDAQG